MRCSALGGSPGPWGEFGVRGRGHLVTHFREKNEAATVVKGVGHWPGIKATAAEQRQLWRDVVGEALLVECRMHKSDSCSGSGVRRRGSAWSAETALPLHPIPKPSKDDMRLAGTD